jgi:hypothetical protein
MSKGVASKVSTRIDRVYATPVCGGNIHCFELSILIDKALQGSIHHDVLTDDLPRIVDSGGGGEDCSWKVQ